MSSKNTENNRNLTKKCGEITITIKKNTKNVFSFNCWFCDTICAQLKKFTLHLEKEHVEELELEQLTKSGDYCNEDDFNDKIEEQKELEVEDSLFVGEVKLEDCTSEYIKTELEEEIPQILTRSRKKEHIFPKFNDPLETIARNVNELPMIIDTQENAFKETDMNIKNESQFKDAEMDNISEYDHSEDDSDYGGADISSDNESKTDNTVDDMLIKPLKTVKDAKEKELIIELIEEYRQKPELWNIRAKKKYNSKEKDELLKNIADNLNAKLNLKLKLYSVKTKLNIICKQYEKIIRKQLMVEDQEKPVKKQGSELWYYKHMNFLKPIMENKIKNKKTKSYHKVKPLSDSLLFEIIEIYKNYNCLWDVNHIAYMVKQKRKENMELLLEEIVNKININLDMDKLEKHLQYIHNLFSKDKKFKLECETKEQEFKPSFFFRNCEFLEPHQGPFKCPHCSKIFIPYKEFQIHKSEHEGSYPFICQKCGAGFKACGNYTIHVKRHLGVFRFCCKICGKGYPVNAELDLHMRSHTGAQPYLCSLCGEGFRTAYGYDNHIRRHEKRFRYNCHICKKGFNVLTFLNDHIRAHLNIRDVICTICGKGFTSKKYLNYHKNIHGSKNYTCNICGKSYAQDAGLRQHKKSHGMPIGGTKTQKS
ncbi:uncharacterized protein ACRADG_008849 [Cochliomyia hominivorax]